MSRSYYWGALINGTSQKTEQISATSPENASYEAQRQNAGWTVKDIRNGPWNMVRPLGRTKRKAVYERLLQRNFIRRALGLRALDVPQRYRKRIAQAELNRPGFAGDLQPD